MKKKIYKIGLLVLIATVGTFQLIAQENSASKKNLIGLGGAANMYYGFGGNVSFYRMISPKLSIGAKALIVPLNYQDNLGAPIEFKNHKGLYSDISVGANYFILGDPTESKFKLFSGLALGFTNDKLTTDIQYTNSNTAFKETEIRNGFSGNITLAAGYKLGLGNIFLEFMPSAIIAGKDKSIYDFPTGSLTDTDGNPIQTGFVNYEYNFSFATTFSWTLGYQINF
jgi:hypothetical protein